MVAKSVTGNLGGAPVNTGDFLGHPKGLTVLFLTEMWERMSYYGMRTLLVLYMVKYLFINPDVGQHVLGFNEVKGVLEWAFGPLEAQPLASTIYGLYTGLVYLTPVLGGIIADRWLGPKKTIVTGAILMCIGHFLMAAESLFFPALLFIIIGSGAFKPNISVQIGDLYAPGDERRDISFAYFYMGINLGAFLAPLICGTLGEKYGWHYGFGAAGVGMIIGLIIYVLGQKHLNPHPENAAKKIEKSAKGEKIPFTSNEKKAIWALIMLCALNIIFWAVYEQQGNTMQLWATDQTDWNILGMDIPSTWFQAMNPLMIFILTPILGFFWKWQAQRKTNVTSVTKMAIGCALLASAYGIMIFAALSVGSDKGSVLWLVMTTLVLSIGELYLSPVGLSLVTKVSPARIVSTMMGLWFISSFFGNFLSGYLGTFYDKLPKENFFGIMAALALVAAVAMAAFNKPLKAALGNH